MYFLFLPRCNPKPETLTCSGPESTSCCLVSSNEAVRELIFVGVKSQTHNVLTVVGSVAHGVTYLPCLGAAVA